MTDRPTQSAVKRAAPLTWRAASIADCALLASMNHRLIQDEKHTNSMSIAQLTERMRGWLVNLEYGAVIFERDSRPVAYALYRSAPEESIYLRQFFVVAEHRRQGVGTAALKMLSRDVLPPGSRISLEVLVENEVGLSFWKAAGFRHYSITMERD